MFLSCHDEPSSHLDGSELKGSFPDYAILLHGSGIECFCLAPILGVERFVLMTWEGFSSASGNLPLHLAGVGRGKVESRPWSWTNFQVPWFLWTLPFSSLFFNWCSRKQY